MAALKASILTLNSSIISKKPQRGNMTIIRGAINIPRRATISSSSSNINSLPTIGLVEEGEMSPFNINTTTTGSRINNEYPSSTAMAKLYAILEAVEDRVEMHHNIGDQRDNWNSLFLTFINALTLAASAMTGIAAASGSGAPEAAMKLSSTVMYVAATGMLSIVNKIQPSQLAEEQRNAVRLFKQLRNQIQTVISIGNPTAVDVKEMMERVLAIDAAYPLPLLDGAMLEKFPARAEPAVWWPENRRKRPQQQQPKSSGYNGWNGKLESEMRSIANVIRRKDEEEYLRLGGKMLKLNKILAVSGPVLTGLAAVGSAFVGSGDWAVGMGVLGGALASVVNAVEHGGQVGMVVEMYRSNAGFFKQMEETIQANLSEGETERRENGKVFEMKVGLQLGRSLSQLRDFSDAASTSVVDDDHIRHQFASKLF